MAPAPLTIRSSDLVRAGLDDRPLRRLASTGAFARIRPGVYLPSNSWSRLTLRDRFITKVHSTASRLSGPVAVSHWSAAAIWGFPVPDEWPSAVEIIDPRCARSTVRTTLHRRPGRFDPADVVVWEGVRVTTAARTAADLALASPFDEAVLVLDHGLHNRLFTKDEVRSQLARRPGARRSASAARAVEFASDRPEFAGESFSRCSMLVRGILSPSLQEQFRESGRLIAVADFWWESVGVVGEFDGHWKYTDERWLRGRTPADAIADEKRRQNLLEAHPGVRRVVRWDYATARDPDELARRLLAAGVPRTDSTNRPWKPG
jgi:hypothetical protein